MRKKLALLSLLMMGLSLCLTGCSSGAPELPSAMVPERTALENTALEHTAESADGEAVIPTAGEVSASEFQFRKPRLGRFNIHKRHGLGGWEGGAPQGTERELLRGLSRTE